VFELHPRWQLLEVSHRCFCLTEPRQCDVLQNRRQYLSARLARLTSCSELSSDTAGKLPTNGVRHPYSHCCYVIDREPMLILSEFQIEFTLPAVTAMLALLHLHPSLERRLLSGNELLAESLGVPFPPNTVVPATDYIDSFGNRCSRFLAPAGHLRLSGSNIIEADPFPDVQYPDAEQMPIEDLPSDVLQFLLPSRYCEVDQFGAIAHNQFGSAKPGWERAVAIRDWVHDKVTFNYNAARPTKTSTDVFIERIGVCRDFQHLAITLTRCMNIPARYVTGYIGDIRHPFSGPGDFSAWYQVFLEGRWIDLDARHNYPRLGRVLMATGRDAADVAITTSFGAANLVRFHVESNEIDVDGNKVPLPLHASEASNPVAAQSEVNTPTQTNPSMSSPAQTQSATS
jgi:transglutaminase-like putative cysteine protease